jgi:hypothetical protein
MGGLNGFGLMKNVSGARDQLHGGLGGTVRARMKELALYLLFAAGTLVCAQAGNTAMRASAKHALVAIPAHSLLISATDEQRMSFAYCMSATDIVHKLAGRMVSRNRHWLYNHKIFASQKDQLHSSIADMIEDHQWFLETLSDEQARALNKNLTEIGHLQSELNERMAQIDREWTSSRPDAQSIAVSVYAIRKIAGEWRSAHKQMAEAMNLSP